MKIQGFLGAPVETLVETPAASLGGSIGKHQMTRQTYTCIRWLDKYQMNGQAHADCPLDTNYM